MAERALQAGTIPPSTSQPGIPRPSCVDTHPCVLWGQRCRIPLQRTGHLWETAQQWELLQRQLIPTDSFTSVERAEEGAVSWRGQVNNPQSQIRPPQVRRDGTKGHDTLWGKGGCLRAGPPHPTLRPPPLSCPVRG